MDAILYPVFTLLNIIIFVLCFRSFRSSNFWGTVWVLFLTLSQIYDNLVMSLGDWIGKGDTLEALSDVRFLLHLFLTPTLVLIALDFMRRLRVRWASKMGTGILFSLYTLVIMIIGIFTEYLWVNFVLTTSDGLTFYTSEPYNPVTPILALIPLLFSGIIVWRRLNWSVMFIGVFISTLGYVAAFMMKSPTITAFFEIVTILILVLTEQKLNSYENSMGIPIKVEKKST